MSEIEAFKDRLNTASGRTFITPVKVWHAYKESKGTVPDDPPRGGGGGAQGRVTLKPMNLLKSKDKLMHMCNIFEYTWWHEQAEAWSLLSNFSVANPSIQKQFLRSIVNNVVINTLQPHITNTTTFGQMLKLAKEYFDNTMTRFDRI